MLRTILLFTLLIGIVKFAAAQTYSYYKAPAGLAYNISSSPFGLSTKPHTQHVYWPGDILDSTLQSVTVNRLYFVRADPLNQNLCALPSNFDTLTFWAGNVGPNQRNFTANYSLPNGKYYAFIPKSQLTKVYQKANASAPAGTNNTWFSYDLDTPFQLDPSKPFVLDITFKGTNTNAQYSTYGGSRFLIGKYPTVTSTNTVDDAGSSTSGFLSFLGVDIVTANKPHHVLKAEAYPNPATQSVSVRVPNPTEATAELVSIDGRRVSLGTQSGWAAWGLPAGLPTGLYTLLVQQQGVAYKTQLAVQ